MKKYVIVMLIIVFTFILGCSSQDRELESDEFRIDVLYEHTKLMKTYSNESTLTKIGLDMSQFPRDDSLLSAEKKKEILINVYNSNTSDIADLENQMNDMMDKWADIEYTE